MADNKTIDLSYLISICNDDREFKIEMIETFMNDIPPIIQAMNDSLPLKKWEEIGGMAHKIKPSFTFMGIESAKQIIMDIEKNGKEKINIEFIPERIGELNKIIALALEELSSELQSIKGEY